MSGINLLMIAPLKCDSNRVKRVRRPPELVCSGLAATVASGVCLLCCVFINRGRNSAPKLVTRECHWTVVQHGATWSPLLMRVSLA